MDLFSANWPRVVIVLSTPDPMASAPEAGTCCGDAPQPQNDVVTDAARTDVDLQEEIVLGSEDTVM